MNGQMKQLYRCKEIFMNQINSLIIEGNVVKNATIKEPTPGFKVCDFTVGVNRFYKNSEDEEEHEVSYFDCESYGLIAEHLSKKIKKGSRVRLVGRLKQDCWINDEGISCSKVYIVVEHIEFYKPLPKEKSAK
jgi:single-strand DNA-binding protein